MPAKTSESEFRGTAKQASGKRLKFLDSPPAFAGAKGRGNDEIRLIGAS
jgi:hypothetical protein